MINKQLYFRLFSNCILVKGYNRSAVCDLTRGNLVLIPNDLHDILFENKNSKIIEIYNQYGEENAIIIDSYFELLLANELIFICTKKELNHFPELDLSYYHPSTITNAILDFNSNSNYDYKKIIQQLDELGCKNIQLRYFHTPTIEQLHSTLLLLEGSGIIGIELYVKYTNLLNEEFYLDLVRKYLRINILVIHSAPKTSILEFDLSEITFTEQVITDNTHCGIISPSYFSINIKTFTEAQQHNSCLNRKISIDVNGDIKNCPSLPQSYGNIATTSLHEALLQQNFKDLWYINKDQIKVCQDCEFRYVCTDCRAFISNPEDKFSKPSKCNYNPYTAEWEDSNVIVN